MIMGLVILDNFLTSLTKKMFPTRWVRTGRCLQCGNCCRKIILTMTPAQIKSRFFTDLSARWISWLFGFKLVEIDRVNHSLAFSCKHLTAEGKCDVYAWRPNVCRNYPLVDYFEKPTFLPGCGYSAVIREKFLR